MAQLIRVRCISRTNRSGPHDRIESIGGINANGTRWTLAESEAIRDIKDDRRSFYVERPPGHVVRIVIATRLGREYLKTVADDGQPDNLLALPECPS